MKPEPTHETEGRVELMHDASAGRWIEERLPEWSHDAVRVGNVVPDGFVAYARIFHPMQRNPEEGGGRLRWSTVASWTGRIVHAEMQLDRIANPRDPKGHPSWSSGPQEGLLPREDCERLANLLRQCTSTPEVCWFCIWDGYGFLDAQRYREIRRVSTPHRSYLLYRGPLEAVTSFHWDWLWQSPNLWWPDDHAWCVATEIDLPETYVGGPATCLSRILADDQLEAMRTRIDARVDINADQVNPPAPHKAG